MKIRTMTLTAGIGILAMLGSLATAQQSTSVPVKGATIYRDGGYRGPAVFVDGDRPDLGLAWPVNSVRVSGGRWILCEKTQYRGKCRTIDADTPMLGSMLRGVTIQSMRPEWTSGIGIGVEANDQVVRGTFAEFHTQPASRGYRIPACPTGRATANCAARTADNYCRSIGWNGSAREHMENVGRVAYLADVLCVNFNF